MEAGGLLPGESEPESSEPRHIQTRGGREWNLSPTKKKAEKMWEFTPCREILPPSSIYSLGSSLKELIHQRGCTTTGNFQVPFQAFPREAHQVRGAAHTYRACRQLRGILLFRVNRLPENIMLEGPGVKL